MNALRYRKKIPIIFYNGLFFYIRFYRTYIEVIAFSESGAKTLVDVIIAFG